MTAIEFEHVSKQYRLGLVSTKTLSHDIHRWWVTNVLRQEDPYLKIGETNDRSIKGNSDYVWALRDIDFKVEQGDVVGIIGKNGAGKSTLLKLLSRVTGPTTGTIRAHGRIGSLLEVGTGFHGEMTGRENIFMNGAILGMTRHEIQAKLDEIIDFSGCERYIDTPVKRYSSGMTVRLGFAVAAFLDPEILVVDEVLAVGDAEFQKKAIGKMKDVSTGEGRTVLFVSHNMASVRRLCKRGILLDKGRLVYDGAVNDVIDFYIGKKEEEERKIIEHIQEINPALRISNISFNNTALDHTIFGIGQEYVDISVEGITSKSLKADLSFTIKNLDEVPLASYNEGLFGNNTETISAGHFRLERRIKLPSYLSHGHCYVDIALHNPGVELFFSAPHSVRLEILGNAATGGIPLDMRGAGLIGLESIK